MKSAIYLLRHQTLLFLLFVLVFIMGDNVAHTFSFSRQGIKFLLLLCCAIGAIKTMNKGFARCPEGRNLLLFIIIYWLFKVATDHTPGAVVLGITLFLPILIYLSFISRIRDRDLHHFKRIFYGVYLLECGIAIIERFILHSTIFVSTFSDVSAKQEQITQFSMEDLLEFRAIGLYGHPLQNALIVFVFLLFILVYERNTRTKMLLSTIGVLAIFCFNARAAILISTASIALYCFHLFQENSTRYGTKLNIFVGYFLIMIVFYVFYSSGLIGGRLLSMGIYDDNSAATRLRVFNVFEYCDWKELFFGINHYELLRLIHRIDVFTIENFWFNIGLSYGIVCVIGLIIFYTLLMQSIFKKETKFYSCFLVIPYIALASTNLSLSVDIVSMTAFLLLSHIMPSLR